MKKTIYTEPRFQIAWLAEEDILAGPSESTVDTDDLFDSEDDSES